MQHLVPRAQPWAGVRAWHRQLKEQLPWEGCARRTLHCPLLPLEWDMGCQPWQQAAAATMESRKLCVQVSSYPLFSWFYPAAELGPPPALTLLHSPWSWSGNEVCSGQQV